MDRTHQSESTTRPENTVVLSIDCLKGSSKSEEWSGDMLQTGDIVEEIRIGSGPGSAIFKAPFKGGKAWLQKVLHNSYRNKETSIVVRVRRGSEDLSDLSACLVPNESAGKRQYMLRSIDDPNYTVGFSDRTESDCLGIQGWSLKDQMGIEKFGLRACGKSLSALHAEMEGLLWAASCMRDMRITDVRFETDCSDLVDMFMNPMDWPSFATEIEVFQRLQEDFGEVCLTHIPRSKNGRADALAKEARNKGYIFSHIGQTRTDGGALRRIGSSATT